MFQTTLIFHMRPDKPLDGRVLPKIVFGEPLVGYRLPDSVFGMPGQGWGEWKQKIPGSYMKVTGGGDYSKAEPGSFCVWHITFPSGIQMTLDSKHSVVEHSDNTITLTPSVFDRPDGWHGNLVRGIWRKI